MAKQGEHGITWTNETWNPIRGCSRVSEGCRNCYAERVAGRFCGPGEPYEGLAKLHVIGDPEKELSRKTEARWTGEVKFIKEHLEDPIRWKKPRMIFVNSMSDLFHEKLTNDQISSVFSVMEASPRHTFQVLTKRPERMLKWVKEFDDWLRYAGNTTFQLRHPHVWLGVSVEDQKTADERIPLLLQTPAAVRWVSYEPALGPVDFLSITNNSCGIDWLVCGGESGPGARSMHPDWARSARDQCVFAGVPFHFKQNGEWIEFRQSHLHEISPSLKTMEVNQNTQPQQCSRITMCRVGKKNAGRLLDGREWNEFPK